MAMASCGHLSAQDEEAATNRYVARQIEEGRKGRITLIDTCRVSAADVMRLTYSYSSRNGFSIGAFDSRVYLRTRIQTFRRNPLMRFVPGMFRLERGTREYSGEMFLNYNYRYPAMVDRRVVASYTTMPRAYDIRERIVSNFNVSTYSSTLWADKTLSPFHRKNRRYYRYGIDSIYVRNGVPWCTMRIVPKFRNTQLVRGSAEINMYTGRVANYSLSGFYDMADIYVTAILGEQGRESLLPREVYVSVYFNMLGNRVNTSFFALVNMHDVISTDSVIVVDSLQRVKMRPRDMSCNFVLTTDTGKVQRDREYFDSIRPVPLSHDELLAYERHEQNMKISNVASRDADTNKVSFIETIEDVALGSHSVNMPHGRLRIPPLLMPYTLSWSKRRGLFWGTKIKFDYDISEDVSLRFHPRIGYNFKDRELYWRVPLEWELMPRHNFKVMADGGRLNNIYDGEQGEVLKKDMRGVQHYDSLVRILNDADLQYYRNYFARLQVSGEPIHGITLTGALSYYNRRLVHWNDEVERLGLLRRVRTLSLKGQIEWTPGYTYYIHGKRKVRVDTPLPTFMVSYERSLRGRGLEGNFERIEMNTTYVRRLYALRTLYLRLGGGLYTRMRNTYFVSYDLFSDNEIFTNLDDDMMGRFHLLDGRWYNESDHYLTASAAYESPMLLISRVPFLSKYIQKERLYYSTLMVEALKPYCEAGYGVSTHALDLGLFFSFANGKGISVGCTFGLRLFHDW